MNINVIPYLFYLFKEDDFEIQIISFYDPFIPSQCLVFYKGNHVSFTNANLLDAIFIDECCIELELFSHTEKDIFYYYYYPETKECIRILEEDSDILHIRERNQKETNDEYLSEFEVPFILLGES